MAYTDISPKIITRERRVFHCTYECLDCTRAGSDWTDVMLCVSHSWCPNCDRRVDEPYDVREVLEYGPEFEESVA